MWAYPSLKAEHPANALVFAATSLGTVDALIVSTYTAKALTAVFEGSMRFMRGYVKGQWDPNKAVMIAVFTASVIAMLVAATFIALIPSTIAATTKDTSATSK